MYKNEVLFSANKRIKNIRLRSLGLFKEKQSTSLKSPLC